MASGIVSSPNSGTAVHSKQLKGQTSANVQSVNVKQLCHELKDKWLTYYCENREWLVQLGIWVTCDGHHRPSSSFILAALSVLEPNLTRLMPLLAGLNSSPDRIVSALGLNFSPEEMVEQWLHEKTEADNAMKELSSTDAQRVEVAFHPEATLVSNVGNQSALSSGPADSRNSNPGLSSDPSNFHQSNSHQSSNGSDNSSPVVNDRSAELDRPLEPSRNPPANGHDPGAIAIAQLNVSQADVIARRDEQCSGRERFAERDGDRDNIWR